MNYEKQWTAKLGNYWKQSSRLMHSILKKFAKYKRNPLTTNAIISEEKISAKNEQFHDSYRELFRTKN